MRLALFLCFMISGALPGMGQQGSSQTFVNHCSACHGGDGTGGRAPSLLGFVRYHTDAEITSLVHEGRPDKGMPSFQLTNVEVNDLLLQLRALAGSNPAMAQGGLAGNMPMKAR